MSKLKEEIADLAAVADAALERVGREVHDLGIELERLRDEVDDGGTEADARALGAVRMKVAALDPRSETTLP